MPYLLSVLYGYDVPSEGLIERRRNHEEEPVCDWAYIQTASSKVEKSWSLSLDHDIRRRVPIRVYVREFLGEVDVEENTGQWADCDKIYAENVLRNLFNRKIYFGLIMSEMEWEEFVLDAIKQGFAIVAYKLEYCGSY